MWLIVAGWGLDHPDGPVPLGGVDEGRADDRPVRLFGTFIVAMDRARDAYVLWQRGLGLFLRAPWAFEPGFVELAETLRRCGFRSLTHHRRSFAHLRNGPGCP
jgi:hypothetical protein